MGERATPPPQNWAYASEMSRRTLLARGTLFTALGLASPSLLAACGTASDGTGPSAGATPTGAGTGTASTDLVIKAVADKSADGLQFRGQIFVTGNIWSDSLNSGWTQAAKDLGINIEFGGPATVDPAAQVAELESWIIQGVDCIMVTAANPSALTPSINKAVAAGIAVVTLDSDAPLSNRPVFDTGADSQALAFAQIDTLAAQMGEKGSWAFIIGQLTQVEKQYQLEQMKARAADMYPDMEFLVTEECKDDQQIAANQAQALIVKYPDLGGIISNSGSGAAGAAQGIKAAGKSGVVKVTGITFPSSGQPYVKDGTMPEFFLWNIPQQAYFAATLGYNMVTGVDTTQGLSVNRWTDDPQPTTLQPSPDNAEAVVAVLGPPLKIDSSNVDTLGP